MPDSSRAVPAPLGLSEMAARLRAELRADEDDWTRAAAQHWAHARTLADLAREFAARGDEVFVETGARSFRGVIVAVGADRVDLETADGVVHLRLALAEPVGSPLSSFALSRAAHARRGGVRPPTAPITFRTRLLELEVAGVPVRIGATIGGAEFVGCLTVGRDHVVVHGLREIVLPACWVSYVVVDGVDPRGVILRLQAGVDTGLHRQPLEELVAQEPQLPPTGEPVGRHLAVAHQPAEVLDVHLEELRGHRRGEDGRELVHDSCGPMGAAA